VPSLQSRILVAYLRASRRKQTYVDPRRLLDVIEKERRTVRAAPPREIRTSLHVEERVIEGSPCYTMWPRGVSSPELHVLFLHGGCYVFEITPHHWHFCAALASRLGCKVTVPIYPLAPEHGVDDALRMIMTAYRETAVGASRAALMGDSAGGGMALALAQLLRDAKLPQPKDIVLLSPWVDAAMDNPDIAAVDRDDPWLAPAGMAEAGRLYARGADPKTDPRVSPIRGELGELGALSIFVGTRDILLPDARLLRDRARQAGGAATLFEYEGMVHDFMLVGFLPEGKRARADIRAIFSAGGSAP
jgi:acetyl esterase/lipase